MGRKKAGEQWCPNCVSLMTRYSDFWKCDFCQYEFSDEDLMFDPGCPTEEAAIASDYRVNPFDYESELDCVVGYDAEGPIYDWSNL